MFESNLFMVAEDRLIFNRIFYKKIIEKMHKCQYKMNISNVLICWSGNFFCRSALKGNNGSIIRLK